MDDLTLTWAHRYLMAMAATYADLLDVDRALLNDEKPADEDYLYRPVAALVRDLMRAGLVEEHHDARDDVYYYTLTAAGVAASQSA